MRSTDGSWDQKIVGDGGQLKLDEKADYTEKLVKWSELGWWHTQICWDKKSFLH